MKSSENRKLNILKAFGVLSSMTLLSRITGYLRDAVIAAFLGASLYSDAFFVAFRIPNMFRRLFGEGALTPAVVPVVTELIKKDKKEKEEGIKSIIGVYVFVVGLITILGIISSPFLVKLMAYGFLKNHHIYELTVNLTMLMFPYLFFISIVAIYMGILNASHHFFAPSFSPVLLNISMIFSLLIAGKYLGLPVYALSFGVLVGGLFQLCFQIPYLKKNHLPYLPIFSFKTKAVKDVFYLLIPSVFGLAITQINIFVDTIVASFLKPGTVSYLYYADRLLELPIGIFTVSFASALLPAVSSKANEDDKDGVVNDFNKTLKNCLFFIFPAMIFLIVLGRPSLSILFKRKAFDSVAEWGTYKALLGYTLGLPFFTFNRLITPLFYAYKKTKESVRAGFFAMLVNVVMDIALMSFGEFGLSLATSLSAIVNALLLFHFYRKKLFSLKFSKNLPNLTKMFLSAVFAGLLTFFITQFISFDNNFFTNLLILFILSLFFVIFYMVMLYLLKVKELNSLWQNLKRFL